MYIYIYIVVYVCLYIYIYTHIQLLLVLSVSMLAILLASASVMVVVAVSGTGMPYAMASFSRRTSIILGQFLARLFLNKGDTDVRGKHSFRTKLCLATPQHQPLPSPLLNRCFESLSAQESLFFGGLVCHSQ